MKKTLLALLLAAWSASLHAADQKFTFALPDLEGRITLGVFNERGKLIRTLATGAKISDFTVGLNGLITTWDGKSDIGATVPPGKYFVRGYVVGDAVKAEGEAYHFNDWIEDETSPRIYEVQDFQKIDRGFVLLARVGPGGYEQRVIRYDLEKGFLWSQSTEIKDPQTAKGEAIYNFLNSVNYIGVSTQGVVTLTMSGLSLKDLEKGGNLDERRVPDHGLSGMAVSGSDVLVATNEELQHFTLPAFEAGQIEKLPSSIAALATSGQARIGASADFPEVWLFQGTEWKKLSTDLEAASAAFGVKDSFWLAGFQKDANASLVAQFNFQGEPLRTYRSEFDPQQVRASTQTEEIAVLEHKAETQRLRQMQQVDRPGGAKEWEIDFEKAVTKCAKFGVVDGSLVPDAGNKPQPVSQEITLATGGLTPSSPKLTVQLVSDSGGLWLESTSHLRLLRLADHLQADRFVLVRGSAEASMTAYAGDGVVVAEYLITGLNNMAEIDAGEIDLP